MKKAVWGAFLLMTTLAAAGLCETDYTLSNPHIRYEKIEGALGRAERGHVAEDIHRYAGRRHDARLDGRFAQAGGLL